MCQLDRGRQQRVAYVEVVINVSATSWSSVMCQLHCGRQQCVIYIVVGNVSATL